MICNHTRLQRINDNFVRCLSCGQSLISQKKFDTNKSRLDFTKENKYFDRNFERNFNNIIEEKDIEGPAPYEYYVDKDWVNIIIINKNVLFDSMPAKYKIFLNGKISIMDNNQIISLLSDTKAIRVDKKLITTKIGEIQF